MYIYLPCDSSQGLGGGFSFRRNFIKGLTYFPDAKYTERLEDADICLIAGPTMVTRQTIDKIQAAGKKLVARLDNVPRNSRNRNTGTSRLKEFSERANACVYQCQWAKDYLKGFLTPKKDVIIYNGIDTDIFNPNGEKFVSEGNPIYLYSRFNRDETKNWEVAWYEFQLIYQKNKNARLLIVGRFSPEQVQYNFDFFRGEQYQYLGTMGAPEQLATVYRGSDKLLAVYFNDCYSNTYLEAAMCGVELIKVDMSGGTPELIENIKKGPEFNGVKRMVRDYLDFFNSL